MVSVSLKSTVHGAARFQAGLFRVAVGDPRGEATCLRAKTEQGPDHPGRTELIYLLHIPIQKGGDFFRVLSEVIVTISEAFLGVLNPE